MKKVDIKKKLTEICNREFYTNQAIGISDKHKAYWDGYRTALCNILFLRKKDYKLPWEYDDIKD